MSKPIIIDTSAIVSLTLHRDSNHQQAVELTQQIGKIGRPVMVPADVFTETLNYLGKAEGHGVAVQVGKMLSSANGYFVVAIPEALSPALQKFAKQPQSVSYTDCIVMACADHFKTKTIFGFDEVFSKNGYTIDL